MTFSSRYYITDLNILKKVQALFVALFSIIILSYIIYLCLYISNIFLYYFVPSAIDSHLGSLEKCKKSKACLAILGEDSKTINN